MFHSPDGLRETIYPTALAPASQPDRQPAQNTVTVFQTRQPLEPQMYAVPKDKISNPLGPQNIPFRHDPLIAHPSATNLTQRKTAARRQEDLAEPAIPSAAPGIELVILGRLLLL
jgi:hypothetical protein